MPFLAQEVKIKKKNIFDVGADEEEHIRVLKHEIPTMAVEDVLKHWKGCSGTRLNSIQLNSTNSSQIYDIWPQYKLPYGHRLVCTLFL